MLFPVMDGNGDMFLYLHLARKEVENIGWLWDRLMKTKVLETKEKNY